MSGMAHFTPIFRDKCTVQQLLHWSLNKGHLFDTSFFTELFTSLIKFHIAIVFNMPFSINDYIPQNQQHACHDCWVCWFSITLPHLLVKYLPCEIYILPKTVIDLDWIAIILNTTEASEIQ